MTDFNGTRSKAPDPTILAGASMIAKAINKLDPQLRTDLADSTKGAALVAHPNGGGLTLADAPAYERTPAEITAGVTPVDYRYPELDVRRYGKNTTPGTTDMTTAIQNAVNVASQRGGGRVYLGVDDLLVTTISMKRGVTLVGESADTGTGQVQTRIIQDDSHTSDAIIEFIGTNSARLVGGGLENVVVYRRDTDAGTECVRAEFCSFMNFVNVQFEGGETGLVLLEVWDTTFITPIFRNNETALLITNNEAEGGTAFDNSNNLFFYHLNAESWTNTAIKITGSGTGSKQNHKIYFYGAKIEGAPDTDSFSGSTGVYLANCTDVHFWGGHVQCKSGGVSTLSTSFKFVHFAGGNFSCSFRDVELSNLNQSPFDCIFLFDDSATPNTLSRGITLDVSIDIGTAYPETAVCRIKGRTSTSTQAAVDGLRFTHHGTDLLDALPLIAYDSGVTNFNTRALATNRDGSTNQVLLFGRFGSLTGTATAGGADTITLDTSAYDHDDLYNGWSISITGGTGSGQSNRITNYVGSTRVATVEDDWETQPDATSTYSITSNSGTSADPYLKFQKAGVPGYWDFGRIGNNGRLQLIGNDGTTGEYGQAIFYGDYESTTGLVRCTQLGGGGWNTGHLLLGSYHIWVDSTGDLRIKSSAPTSDTDGTVIGTQS